MAFFCQVLTNANNRFLWVEFQLDEICAEHSDNGIERALKRVPKDMNTTYERILNIINEKPGAQRELARKALIWTAYTRRPLPIDALASAISIERDTRSKKDLESSIPPEQSIVNACANLISVDRETPRYVRFIHFSVQEFFTSQSEYLEILSMGYEMAHREITQACMIFLTLLPKERGSLGLYAFDEWPHHLLAGGLNSLPVDDQIVTLVSSFFDTSPLAHMEQPRSLDSPSSITKVYLKFRPRVLALIFNLPGTQKRWPLQLPAEEEEYSKVVFDSDLKCNILSEDKLAMHYVVAQLDSVPVAQRLYHSGYPMNYSYFNIYRSETISELLQVSLLYSVHSVQMARFLLDNGVSMEPQVLRHNLVDPLVHFVRRGNWGEEVFQFLLGRLKAGGQNGDRFGRVLIDKILVNDVVTIQLLLDKGANVDIQGGEYGSALQAAAKGGNVEVVRLLLDKGANVDIQGREYGSALEAAVWGGNVEVVRLLLDKGANVDIQGGGFGNALQTAVWSGDVEVVRLLLDKGANVNIQGGEYGSALQAAATSWRDSVEVVWLLLDKGASVNIQGGTYGNALQAAAWRGNVELVRLLLDKGAGVHVQGGEYGTALQAALAPSDLLPKYPATIFPIVELLLDYGADITTYVPGSKYGDALTAAKAKWEKDRHSLDAFLELLASRGLKEHETESKENVFEGGEGESNDGVLEGGEAESNGGVHESSNTSRFVALVHVWKLFGFTFLVFILYALIQFWV